LGFSKKKPEYFGDLKEFTKGVRGSRFFVDPINQVNRQ
jgi:hypothetical protein